MIKICDSFSRYPLTWKLYGFVQVPPTANNDISSGNGEWKYFIISDR